MTLARPSLSLVVFCLAATVGMTAFASSMRIVNQEDVGGDWQPAGGKGLVKAGYPAGDKSRDICINIGYQISKDGSTSNFSVIRAWSSENPDTDASADALTPFVQAAAATVSLWKFEPTATAAANREMYSSVAVPFVGTKGTPVDEVSGRCRVKDLKSYVQNEKNEAYRRGSLAKDKLDRYRRDNNQMQ